MSDLEPSPKLDASPACPKLEFQHAGVTRTLNKNPKVQLALKRGQMTLAEALAKPWYLRALIEGRERLFVVRGGDKDAVRAAKDILNGRIQDPSAFSAFIAQRDSRRGITIGQLAAEWYADGLPFSKTKPRRDDAAAHLRMTLNRALGWWKDKPAAAVSHDTMENYVVWRRQNVKRGAGNRVADLELSALSSLCQWAVFTGRLEINPFARRARYQEAQEIKHCHETMPETDEQLHKILTSFWTVQYEKQHVGPRHNPLEITLRARIAGAWLAFTALSGLRPEEPQELFRVAALTSTPPNLEKLLPGTVFPTRDGVLRMKVVRYKRGQNPFVVLQPPAQEFLATWNTWLDNHISAVPAPALSRLFPKLGDPTLPFCNSEDTSVLNDCLARACASAGVTAHITPKGFGRAVYVRVRRSQGADDGTIAGELGQTTNGKLIRTTYGNPGDMMGGLLHDWLPELPADAPAGSIPPKPAWVHLLDQTGMRGALPGNLIVL